MDREPMKVGATRNGVCISAGGFKQDDRGYSYDVLDVVHITVEEAKRLLSQLPDVIREAERKSG